MNKYIDAEVIGLVYSKHKPICSFSKMNFLRKSKLHMWTKCTQTLCICECEKQEKLKKTTFFTLQVNFFHPTLLFFFFFFFRLVLLYPCQIIRAVQYVRKMYFFSNVCTLYWLVNIAYMYSFVYIHYLCMFYRITCPKKILLS